MLSIVLRLIIRTACVLCTLLMFSIYGATVAQAKSVEKQSVFSVLAFNTARFTSWPESVFGDANINLCVIGDNVVQESFLAMENKKIKGKTVRVLNHTRLRNLSECHVLYINGLEKSVLVLVLRGLKDQAILTVGEGVDFIHAGGMVGLEKLEEKVQLNINVQIIKQAKLVVSSRLLSLAKIFRLPYPE